MKTSVLFQMRPDHQEYAMHRLPSAAPLDELWRLTLAELRLQTAVVTFDTWLAGSRVVVPACTPFFWVIAVRSELLYMATPR
jgi:hypothetical protein